MHLVREQTLILVTAEFMDVATPISKVITGKRYICMMPKGECIFISGNAQVPVLKLIDATFSTKICLNSMEILFDDFLMIFRNCNFWHGVFYMLLGIV